MSVSLVPQNSMFYLLPGGLGKLEFPQPILKHFEHYQQLERKDKEAGGQLFWEHDGEGNRRVAAITGPRESDQRSRTGYKANHRQEQLEINRFFEQGLYLLGDWHTHPETIAHPSASDIQVIQEIYRTSQNRGLGLLLVIVGTRHLQDALHVSWCNEKCLSLERCK